MPVTKNVSITAVVASRQLIAPNYHTVYLERPAQFNYAAGDWIDLEFSPAVQGGRTYSLSSSPTEPQLAITFRAGMSQLKQRLASLQSGDGATIVQYGNDYGFQLKPTKASTLIAGGVGIAPFRSMLKNLVDTNGRADVQLLYLNSNDDFLFRHEIETWQQQLSNLRVEYIVTKDLSRKKREKHIASLLNDTNRQFYIAGPPGMVANTQTLLSSIKIAERDIKTDIFGGY
ncbi:MAG: FAD-dependent oxidoreductase [Chloroflexi bacterium]|nr:MAG: FAD-dependent oxidoreductase [Chloroflexota bacterium]